MVSGSRQKAVLDLPAQINPALFFSDQSHSVAAAIFLLCAMCVCPTSCTAC